MQFCFFSHIILRSILYNIKRLEVAVAVNRCYINKAELKLTELCQDVQYAPEPVICQCSVCVFSAKLNWFRDLCSLFVLTCFE